MKSNKIDCWTHLISSRNNSIQKLTAFVLLIYFWNIRRVWTKEHQDTAHCFKGYFRKCCFNFHPNELYRNGQRYIAVMVNNLLECNWALETRYLNLPLDWKSDCVLKKQDKTKFSVTPCVRRCQLATGQWCKSAQKGCEWRSIQAQSQPIHTRPSFHCYTSRTSCSHYRHRTAG